MEYITPYYLPKPAQVAMTSLPRKRLRTASPSIQPMIYPDRCIICQKIIPGQKTASTDNGRDKIIHAAGIRKDIVSERLKQIDHSDIAYHVNIYDCYKKYTHPRTLEGIEKSNSGVDNQSLSQRSSQAPSDEKRRSRRSMEDVDVFTKKCVICGYAKHNKTYEKCRISTKPRAETFLEAVSLLQDDVFTRVCDLHDVNAVYGADLYCHKHCFKNYERKAEAKKKEATDTCTSEEGEDLTSEDASGAGPDVQGETDFRKCGAVLRECFMKQDIDLNDKFCDANELENAYNNIVIPSEIADFLSTLFNIDIRPNTPCNINTACDSQKQDTNLDSSKMRKVLSVYQILFFILNNGRKCTPLHMMNSESVYSVCRSKTLISSLNRFGLAISYDELMRYHSGMASYVTEISRNHIG